MYIWQFLICSDDSIHDGRSPCPGGARRLPRALEGPLPMALEGPFPGP